MYWHGRCLIRGAESGLRIWDAGTGDLVRELNPGSAVVNAEFSRNGAWIGAWTTANEVRIWDGRTGELSEHRFRHRFAGFEVGEIFRPGADQVWTCSPDTHSLQLWNVVDGRPMGNEIASDSSTTSVAFDRNGGQAAINSWTRAPEVWLLGEGFASLRSRQAARRFNFLRFSPLAHGVVLERDLALLAPQAD